MSKVILDKISKTYLLRETMNLIINGENKEFTENSSLQTIISQLQIEDKVMAAAVNMEIVKKEQWKDFSPKENDKVELLQFVGGG